MIKVPWAQLKNAIDNKQLLFQWVQDDNSYVISAIDNSFELQAVIPIITPISGDQIDFETNYKANGNQVIKASVIQVLGKDNISLCPFGSIFTATHGQTINADVVLPYTMVLKGGVLFSQNAEVGDYINVSVIDKDNVLGLGGTPTAPTVLGQYVYSWYIMPGIANQVEDISISQTLVQGLYMRITYTSVSTSVDPIVIMNFLSFNGV